MLGSPGKYSKGVGVRVQEKVGMNISSESLYCRSVNCNAVFKGAVKLARHDRYILLLSEHIAKGKTNEFNIHFAYELHDLLFCVLHNIPAF